MNSKQVLKEVFGFDEFRGDQGEIIAATLKGQNTLVLMPTGMGKSLCYQIPARLMKGTTLVISPLIALMKDQVDQAKKRGLRVAAINSSLSKKQRESLYNQLAENRLELVYVSPERFRNKEFRAAVKKSKINLLAIDEAHCVSEWGHDFRPDYTRISEFRTFMKCPPVMALTATATPNVQQDILKQIGLKPNQVSRFVHGIQRPNIDLAIKRIHGFEGKLDAILPVLKKINGSKILYFALVKSLEAFSEALSSFEVEHVIYHGQLSASQRKNAQDAFMSGECKLVLATNAFGLGVDKQDIRFVGHLEIPGSIESYYQEVGRSGRDGKPASALLLYDEDDVSIQMDFIKWSNPDPEFIRSVYSLIEDSPDRVNSGGYGYLREQMNFYNRRDFRVETAVNLLGRWDCIEGEIERRNIKTTNKIARELLNPERFENKIKNSQRKLLDMVMMAKLPNTKIKPWIYHYFGANDSSPTKSRRSRPRRRPIKKNKPKSKRRYRPAKKK